MNLKNIMWGKISQTQKTMRCIIPFSSRDEGPTASGTAWWPSAITGHGARGETYRSGKPSQGGWSSGIAWRKALVAWRKSHIEGKWVPSKGVHWLRRHAPMSSVHSWGPPESILGDYLWRDRGMWCVQINSRGQRSWTTGKEGASVSQMFLAWPVRCFKTRGDTPYLLTFLKNTSEDQVKHSYISAKQQSCGVCALQFFTVSFIPCCLTSLMYVNGPDPRGMFLGF